MWHVQHDCDILWITVTCWAWHVEYIILVATCWVSHVVCDMWHEDCDMLSMNDLICFHMILPISPQAFVSLRIELKIFPNVVPFNHKHQIVGTSFIRHFAPLQPLHSVIVLLDEHYKLSISVRLRRSRISSDYSRLQSDINTTYQIDLKVIREHFERVSEKVEQSFAIEQFTHMHFPLLSVLNVSILWCQTAEEWGNPVYIQSVRKLSPTRNPVIEYQGGNKNI